MSEAGLSLAGSGYNFKYLFLIAVPGGSSQPRFSHPRTPILSEFPFSAIRILWTLLMPPILPVQVVLDSSINNWDGLTFVAFLSSLCMVKWVVFLTKSLSS